MTSFRRLSEVFEKVELIQSRTEITKILADLYKTLDKTETEIVSYLINGRVAPMFVKAEFNYSEKSLVRLLESLVNANKDDFHVKEEFLRTGDIGDLVYAYAYKKDFKSTNLSIGEIYEYLWSVVNISGKGSVERKTFIISDLLKKMSPQESKYFTRIICGALRLGVNTKTLLDVFSFCVTGDKSLREELDRAYGVSADIGYIASKSIGSNKEMVIKELRSVRVNPGIPILPRLVERVGSFKEVFERMGSPVLVQPKFDGLRCQIHKFKIGEQFKTFDVVWKDKLIVKNKTASLFSNINENSQIVLFTRNLENVTDMFPEVVDSAKRIDKESFVLDSEILGWSEKKRAFLSYQETMQRRRKYLIEKKMKDIPVRAMVFDVLYENGQDLTQIDTKKRIKILNEEYKNTGGGIKISETEEVFTEEDLEKTFEKYVSEGLEGIVVKQEDGEYKAGFRNYEWIKIKKSMRKGLVDTIDMVIVGYFKGMGRRKNFGLGAFLGAIYNTEEETFDAICKVGTGLTDEFLKELTERLEREKIKGKYKDVRVEKSLIPDVWVKPLNVVTIEADEITRKLGKSERSIGAGLSLRFPRLVGLREDKSIEDITTVKELVEMFEMQRNRNHLH